MESGALQKKKKMEVLIGAFITPLLPLGLAG